MLDRFRRIDLDPDLVGAHPSEGHLRDPGEREQVVAHVVDELFHRALVRVGVERDDDGRKVGLDLVNDDVVYFVGEIHQRIDLALYLLDGELDVGPLVELDRDHARALVHGRVDLLHIVEIGDGVLDFRRERVLDLFGRSARVRRDDRHHSGRDIREELTTERGPEHQPRADQREHDQVRDDVLLDSEGRERHQGAPCSFVSVGDTSSSTSPTAIPSRS